MANNANLDLLSMEFLKALESPLVFSGVANTVVANGLLQKGDKKRLDQVPDITINSYTGSTITAQAMDLIASTIEITEDKYFAFDLDTVDYANLANGIAAEGMRKAAYAQMDNVDAYMAGIYAQAGITHYTAASPLDMTSANVEDAFIELGEKFALAGVPRSTPKFCIIPPWVTSKIAIAGLGTKTDNSELYRMGYVFSAFGFDFLESNNVSKNSTSWDITRIIAGVPGQSFGLAMGVSAVESAELESYVGKTRMKGRFVYGSKIIRPDMTAVFYADKTAEA